MTSRSLEVNLNLVPFYTPMMSLFTHGKKILGVKGSKPNFTSKDDLFPQLDRPIFPQGLLVYGIKIIETKEAKK